MIFKLLVIACFLSVEALESEVFSTASYGFAGNLLKKITEEKNENIIISPCSIQKSLTMSMLGASGQTEKEMRHVMNYDDISNEEVIGIYEHITKEFKNYNTLKSANKFYVMKKYSLKPSFNDIALKTFDSEVENINFEDRDGSADKINEWIESKTDHKIKNLVKPETLDSLTRLVIVNAVHFKDQWHFKFDPQNTYKSKFYLDEEKSVEADFMSIKSKFAWKFERDIESFVVEVPYKDPGTSMVIVSPTDKTGLFDLEKKDSIDWKNIGSGMTEGDIVLEIPKFKYEFEIELNKVLDHMGMKKMFTDSAEFPNLIDSKEELFISQVIHKAFIEVNEEGTEAAAATIQNIKLRTGPMTIRVNKPFLFFIKSKGHVLFMGRYVKP